MSGFSACTFTFGVLGFTVTAGAGCCTVTFGLPGFAAGAWSELEAGACASAGPASSATMDVVAKAYLIFMSALLLKASSLYLTKAKSALFRFAFDLPRREY